MDPSSDHSAQAVQVFELLRELVASNPIEWQKATADQHNSFGLLIRIGAIEATFQTVVALNGDNQRMRITGKVSGDYSHAQKCSAIEDNFPKAWRDESGRALPWHQIDSEYKWIEYRLFTSVCRDILRLDEVQPGAFHLIWRNKPSGNISVDFCELLERDDQPTESSSDSDAYVEANQLSPKWSETRENFKTWKACAKWLDSHKAEIPNHSQGRRRKVHAAKWMKYWSEKDADAFAKLDSSEPQPITDVGAAFADEAVLRYQDLFKRKSRSKK